MTGYNVFMGQGITVKDLTGDGLMTGFPWDRTDYLHTCSAVIMVDTSRGAAGLFHVPAGNVSRMEAVADHMTRMWQTVTPDWVRLYHGKQGRYFDNIYYFEKSVNELICNRRILLKFVSGLYPNASDVAEDETPGFLAVHLYSKAPAVLTALDDLPKDFSPQKHLLKQSEGDHGDYVTYGP